MGWAETTRRPFPGPVVVGVVVVVLGADFNKLGHIKKANPFEGPFRGPLHWTSEAGDQA